MAGEIQLNSTSFASESGGTITINNATLASAVDLSNHYASTSEVQGTHPTGTITTGTNSLTVSDATGINVGDYVTGEGIAPGTTVSAVSGTSITLSGTVSATLSSDPVSFYKADKVLSPGLVAGGLCRAWVNFDGDTSPYSIRSSYNISSISRTALGTFTVSFTTAMPDEKYSIGGIPNGAATTIGVGSLATSGFTAYCYYRDSSSAFMKDPDIFCLQVFR